MQKEVIDISAIILILLNESKKKGATVNPSLVRSGDKR
jgi:hypothetical protein